MLFSLASINVAFAADTCVVAGTESLTRENWNLNSELNLMPEISEGVYEITYEDVTKGSYELKFTSAANWNYAFCGTYAGNGVEADAYYGGGDNIKFSTDYDLSDVTIKLDLSNFVYSARSGAKFTITITEPVEETAEVVEITSFDGTTAKVAINLDEVTEALNLRVAIYNDDDVMLQVKSMDLTENDVTEKEFPFTNTYGVKYAKAFLWYDGT